MRTNALPQSKAPQRASVQPSVREFARPSRPLSAGWAQESSTKCSAANIASSSTITILSNHPDAVRRREQAAARRAAAQVEAAQAQRSDWWQTETPGNMVCANSPDEFRRSVDSNGLVVAEFFAPWCAACRRMYPKLLQIAENNKDIRFVAVNGGDPLLSAFVEGLGVDRLPFFQFYRGGLRKAQFAANLSKIGHLRAELAHLRECKEPQVST